MVDLRKRTNHRWEVDIGKEVNLLWDLDGRDFLG